MTEFNKQLQRNLQKDIDTFINGTEFAKIRSLYKNHFEEIKRFIKQSGNKLAIEDIANIDKSLSNIIIDNMLLLKEINKAIDNQLLNIQDFK